MRLIYLLTILIMMSGSLCLATDPKIKIIQTGDIELDLRVKLNELHIPIAVDSSLKNKLIKVKVVSVKRNNIIYPALRAVFQTIVKEQESTLLLTFITNKLYGVGKYELLLEVREETTKLLDYLTLVVVYPEGTLNVPSSLTMSLTSYFVFDQTDKAPPLLLSESGGISGLSNINLPVLQFSGDCTRHQQIRFVPKIIDLLPKQTKPVRYSIDGNFPLGSSQASYSLSTLSNQAVIRVEVYNRLFKGFILMAIVAGIFVGFMFRRVIIARKTLASYQIQGLQLHKQLQQAVGENLDALFRQKCEHIDVKIRSVVSELKTDLLTTENESFKTFENAIKAASADLQTALQDLQNRRDVLKTSTESLKRTLPTPYQLPPSVLSKLSDDNQKMQPILDALEKGLFSNGQDKLDDLLRTIKLQLDELLQAYRKNRLDFAALAKNPKLPQPVLDAFIATIEWVNQTTFSLQQFSASTETLPTQLQEWSTDYTGWEKEVLRFANTLKNYFRDLPTQISQVDPTRSKSELQDLFDSIFFYTKSLEDKDRYVNINRVVLDSDALSHFEQNWYQFFVNIPNQNNAFKNCLASRDYVCAVQNIESRKLLGGSLSEENVQTFTEPDAAIPVSSSHETSTFGPLKTASTTVSIQMVLNEREKWEWAETLTSALLICLLGYQLYEKTFVGTWTELIAIFFWGFGLDITASSLTDTIKNAIKK